MTPPPNSGNAKLTNDDDPLGGMDPMAWLESLARRQGANPDELTTAADLEVPTPPADTVIDEPGYTPGYDTGKLQSAKAISEEPKEKSLPPAPVANPAPILQPAAKVPELPPAAPTLIPQPVAATEDDPLGGMDPMAWLESLARRQGANLDELTTAADLNIATPPPDTVIDEPGYTPGYETSKMQPVTSPEPPKTATPLPVPQAKPAAAIVIPTPPTESVATPAALATPPPAAKAVPPTLQPVAAATEDDPLGGMDPMAWLESLARRQGANPDELTTAANLDVPVPPPGTVIDEPGYVDYDPFTVGERQRAEPRQETRQPVSESSPVEPVVAETPLADLDPLAWLESLTTGEVTSTDEPATVIPPAASIDIPSAKKPQIEPAMSTDEAAQVLGISAPGQPEQMPDSMAAMDPMAWLESLATGQNTDLAELMPSAYISSVEEDYLSFAAVSEPTTSSESMAPESTLSWLEELTKSQPESAATAVPIEARSTESVSIEAGGLSDDIEEVQRWLDEQAKSSVLTRTKLEEEEPEPAALDLAPAEPGELPDWLKESLVETPTTEAPVPLMPQASVLNMDIMPPPTPTDLPDWLKATEPESEIDFETAFMQMTPSATTPVETPVGFTPEELVQLTQPASADEIDPWAEALDEEYERRHAGDEPVPSWYLEAMRRADASFVQAQPVKPSETTPQITREPVATPNLDTDFELPDWLREPITDTPIAEAEPGELPDWLRSISPEPQQTLSEPMLPGVPQDVLDWFNEPEIATAPDVPTWLKGTGKLPPLDEPTPEFVQPMEAEQPVQVAASISQPEPIKAVEPEPIKVVEPEPIVVTPPVQPVSQPAVVQTHTPRQQIDHHTRLNQARHLVANNNVSDSLEHYQALIDDSQMLEETRGDLRDLIDKNPKEPRLHRLLGDTHMRLGNLQDALDTYRNALDQL